MNNCVIALSDEKATLSLGSKIAYACESAMIIYLYGNIGTGKTTLVRGFLQTFCHHELVRSPTYTLVESYQQLSRPVYHFDLYRLTTPEDLEFIGIRDYFSDDSICLVEWPQNGIGILPSPDLSLTMSYDIQAREAKIEIYSHRATKLITRALKKDFK